MVWHVTPRWIGALFLTLVLPVAAVSAQAADLVPHKAVYSIKTATVRQGSDYVSINGAMTIAVEKTCEAWIVAQEISMILTSAEGVTSEQGLRFTSWESLDGTRFRFAARNRVDDTIEETKGRAGLPKRGAAGQAFYSVPEEKSLPLPERTFFPVGHTNWIIDSARAGRRHLPHNVFDGADADGPNPAVVFIASRVDPPLGNAEPLLNSPGWVIRLSYYAQDSRIAEPEYEVQALQLENGISPRLVLDYQDFTALMSLTKVEALPSPKC